MNRIAGVAALLCAAATGLEAGPVFNYTIGSGITVGDQVYNGFVSAGNYWASRFSDPITINVQINYSALGSGILGQAGSAGYRFSYSAVKGALAADATTANDATAVANLQSGTSLTFAQNHTSTCGNCTTPYLDNNTNTNNTRVDLTGAQAKAVGLLAANNAALDATITFSSNFAFDFDASNGIGAGLYDFVGIATHEIGHMMGFVSTVDDWDDCGFSPAPSYCTTGVLSESQDAPSVLDLYRFSTDSGFGTRMDQSADTRAKYFSIDGGATLGPQFSTGTHFGDGRQASHWKDNLGIGIMDPTAGAGELLSVSGNDLKALDVIGWDLITTPEPFTGWLAGAGLAAAILRRKRG